jgi:uncharacterized protein (DUF2345 family)
MRFKKLYKAIEHYRHSLISFTEELKQLAYLSQLFYLETMAQQHKASLLLQKHGKLEVTTRQTPVPQGGQALVKVTAAAGKC